MCYACAYNDNPSREGYNCVTSPQNITSTENQVKCDLYKICHVEKRIAVCEYMSDYLHQEVMFWGELVCLFVNTSKSNEQIISKFCMWVEEETTF